MELLPIVVAAHLWGGKLVKTTGPIPMRQQ
jgi:hypothetical protein